MAVELATGLSEGVIFQGVRRQKRAPTVKWRTYGYEEFATSARYTPHSSWLDSKISIRKDSREAQIFKAYLKARGMSDHRENKSPSDIRNSGTCSACPTVFERPVMGSMRIGV